MSVKLPEVSLFTKSIVVSHRVRKCPELEHLIQRSYLQSTQNYFFKLHHDANNIITSAYMFALFLKQKFGEIGSIKRLLRKV